MNKRTSGESVYEIGSGSTATFAAGLLGQVGQLTVAFVEVLDTSGTGSTVKFGANGPTRHIAPNERYVLDRDCQEVVCVSGAVEVVFCL